MAPGSHRNLQLSSLAGRRSARRRARSGQELVEFAILITFFLIVFFCTIQVCVTAMEKFHLNHYALVTARSWSTGPNGATTPGTFYWIKKAERDKKGAFGIALSRADGIRQSEMSINFLPTANFDKPAWAMFPTNYNGVTIRHRIPIVMPYAEMVMGTTPRVFGHRATDARSFIPMEKEPEDRVSDEYDNNGTSWPTAFSNKINIDWIRMQAPSL